MKKIFFTTLILICIANNIYSQTVSIDESFGENGFVTISDGGVGFLDFDVQSNIIAFGNSSFGCPTIWKTDANGVVDKNFGKEGAVVLCEYRSNWGKEYGVKITDENKIVIIFLVHSHGSGAPDDPQKNIMMRFNEDGSIDKSFGVNGEIILDNIVAVNTENDDYVYFSGVDSYYDNSGLVQKPYISKYNYNGEIDTNFGEEGKAYLPNNNSFRIFPQTIKVLRNGSIVVAGYEKGIPIKLAFCKLTSNGAFDINFANNGTKIVNIENNNYSKSFHTVVEENNGNLLFFGMLIETGPLYCSLMCSFNSNGTINGNFGENGFFYYNKDNSNTIGTVLQKGNNVLIGKGKTIISINNNGTLDTQFNNNGSFIFETFSIGNMKLQTSNKIIVGGREGLVRLTSDDVCEHTFTDWQITQEPTCSATGIKTEKCTTCGTLGTTTEPTDKLTDDECNGTVGIAGVENTNVKTYPNPVKNELQIESDDLKINQVKIVDLSGKTIYQFNGLRNQINVSALPKGIYFVKLETDKGIITKKFMKE